MPFNYEKLYALLGERKPVWLRQNKIHPTTLAKMRKNEPIATVTIVKICKLLDCQPGDIMEYVPDSTET